MRSTRRFTRGFTLIELLIVVAMVGVLAALAIVGYRKYLSGASSGEAKAVIQGIRAGEEAYKAETLVYIGCSGCGNVPCAPGAGNLTTYYPRATPNDQKAHWIQGHPDQQCWALLNVRPDGPVKYVYSVVSGAPQVAPPAFPGLATAVTFPPVIEIRDPYFLVQAKGDVDNDGTFSYFVSSSFAGEIHYENDTE